MGPEHPFAVGVMEKITGIGVDVLLTNVPVIGLLVPLPGIPVTFAVLSLIQVKFVFATLPERAIGEKEEPEQMGACVEGVAEAVGIGFTKTVAVIGAPVQLPALGVIVKVTTTGLFVVLVKVPLIVPLPLAGIPVPDTVLSLVQENVAFGTLL